MDAVNGFSAAVDVFRHTYSMSPNLDEALNTIRKTGHAQPRLFLYGSNEVELDRYDVADHMYDKPLIEMEQEFRAYPNFIHLDAAFKYRDAGSRALFLLRARNQRAFNDIEATLDVLKTGPFESLVRKNHYLYVDIAKSELNEVDVVRSVMRTVRERLADPREEGYYTVSTDSIKRHGQGVVTMWRQQAYMYQTDMPEA